MPDQLADLYKFFLRDFPMVSIKDQLDQDNWGTWQKFTASTSIQVVDNDLRVTTLSTSPRL